ncbi:TPA: hypothetical protein NV799_002858 [Escherichia coli]|nr:hypothetical protein [Escherichia coli]
MHICHNAPSHKLYLELLFEDYKKGVPKILLSIPCATQTDLFGRVFGCTVNALPEPICAPVDVCVFDEHIEDFQFTFYANNSLPYDKLYVRELKSNQRLMYRVYPPHKWSVLEYKIRRLPYEGVQLLDQQDMAFLEELCGFEIEKIHVIQEISRNVPSRHTPNGGFPYEFTDTGLRLVTEFNDVMYYAVCIERKVVEKEMTSTLKEELAQFIRDVEEKSKSDHIFSQRYPELIDETTDSVVDGIRIFPSGLAIYRLLSVNQLKVMEMLKDVLAEAGWEYRFDCNFEGMALFVTKKNYTLSIDLPKSQYYSFFPKAYDRTEKEPAMLLDAAESNTLMMHLRSIDKKLNTSHLTTIGKDYGWKSIEPYGSQLLFVADL